MLSCAWPSRSMRSAKPASRSTCTVLHSSTPARMRLSTWARLWRSTTTLATSALVEQVSEQHAGRTGADDRRPGSAWIPPKSASTPVCQYVNGGQNCRQCGWRPHCGGAASGWCQVIIDCHGHYTTTPPAVGRWREAQTAAVTTDPSFVGAKGAIAVVRRRDPREPGRRPAEAPAGAGHRPHDLLAPGQLDGSSHRQPAHLPVLVGAPERPDPASVRPVPRQLRAGVPAAAVAGCADRRVGGRARPLRGRWASSAAT